MDFLTPNSLYALNSVIENESSQAQIHNMTMESNETPYNSFIFNFYLFFFFLSLYYNVQYNSYILINQ